MKTIVFTIFLCVVGIALKAQAPDPVEPLKKEITEQGKKLDRVSAKVDTIKTAIAKNALPCGQCIMGTLSWGLWLYVLLPIILFIVIGLYFMRWLKKDGFKISDALSGDLSEAQLSVLQEAQVKSLAAGSSPPAPALNRSSSRLIAFLSSLSAVILAVCLFSYYMYFAVKGLTPPDFEKLWAILAAMGIGVIPYAAKILGGNSK